MLLHLLTAGFGTNRTSHEVRCCATTGIKSFDIDRLAQSSRSLSSVAGLLSGTAHSSHDEADVAHQFANITKLHATACDRHNTRIMRRRAISCSIRHRCGWTQQ